MRVMVIVKATERSERGELPQEKLMAEMGRFNEELVKAGLMKFGDGLRPSSEGIRVRFSGVDRTISHGPFENPNELVAGFWIWEVSSMDEALAWVKRCPNPMLEDSDIEIRPFYELSDFEDCDPSGELIKKESDLRVELSMQEANVQPYLFFGGNCEEALTFYQKAMNAEIGMLVRNSESPESPPEGVLPEGYENKIMHAEFTVGKVNVMASDGCGESVDANGFRLALTVPTEVDAKRVFASLEEGGEVVMPLGDTFWSPCFGMVNDKFGVGWMVMVPDTKEF